MNKRTVPIFQLKFDETFRKQFRAGVEQILDEGFLTNHTFVRKFEAGFAKATGAKFALGVSNGTTAIEAPLRALNVRGKEVLVQTNTFIATAAAVESAGGTPIPVDIEMESFCLSPEKLEKAIGPKTGAVVIVHIAGLISPHIRRIVEICRKHNVPLVEDCAQAFGSTFEDTGVGNFGAAGAFSFQTTKNMTMGEGGAVVCNDEALYNTLRSVRQFGMNLSNSTIHERDGSNFKMPELSALAGVCELERVQSRIQKRQLLAARYQQNLKGTSWKAVVPVPGVTTGYYKQVVISPLPRDQVTATMKERGVMLTGGVYFVPLHRQPIYKGRFPDADFPAANFFGDNHICPPCYPELELEDIDYVTEQLLEMKR